MLESLYEILPTDPLTWVILSVGVICFGSYIYLFYYLYRNTYEENITKRYTTTNYKYLITNLNKELSARELYEMIYVFLYNKKPTDLISKKHKNFQFEGEFGGYKKKLDEYITSLLSYNKLSPSYITPEMKWELTEYMSQYKFAYNLYSLESQPNSG